MNEESKHDEDEANIESDENESSLNLSPDRQNKLKLKRNVNSRKLLSIELNNIH